jgi:predicted dehydrogenase
MQNTPAPLPVVLVGCGSISRTWLTAAKDYPGLQIVGLVDVQAAQAQKLQAEWQLTQAQIGTDVSAMITRTGAQIVFDCSIPEAHADVTCTALAKGCHVLGEKPMADSLANAQRMLAAARHSGKIYAVIQNRRYLPGIIRFRQLLAAQALGQLTTLNADFYIGTHFGGFRDVMEHVLLLDMAIHSFDQARYLIGADPVAVYCHEWNPAGSWYRHGASAITIFELSNGVVFTYRGSWCAEGFNTSWECTWRAIGTHGTALWDGGDGITAESSTGMEGFIRPTLPVVVPDNQPLLHTGHAGVIYEFLDCVRQGGIPQTICTDNIHSLAMVHGAIHSATIGQRVTIQAGI